MNKDVVMTAARSRESGEPDERRQLDRLRAELHSARTAMPFIDALDAVSRQRALDELQSVLPDLASCAARTVGAAAVIAELQWVGDASSHAASWCPRWERILGKCTEAALASD